MCIQNRHTDTPRSRSDHVMQLQYDIATYFGYNTFLVGKLMKLFPADEVSCVSSTRLDLYLYPN